MKRIGCSFLGGIILSLIILFVCLIASLCFADFAGPPGQLNTMQKIVSLPLMWSTHFGEVLFPQTYRNISKTEALTYYVAGCNILLYSVLSYLFFPFLKAFGAREIQSNVPPEPPVFENDKNKNIE
jgi:hypothetical protein